MSHGLADRPARDRALDLLRGIVILLMVVDHVRFFLSYRGNPTDPALVTPAIFFTRWVTHFCAPVFMLLAGAGAWLSLGRGRSPASLSRYLLSRGAWLVLLELTVARWGWQFNLDYGFTSALVFWALGWSMIALAGLVRLPAAAVGTVGIAMIALHDAFDGVEPARLGGASWLWTILHAPARSTRCPGQPSSSSIRSCHGSVSWPAAMPSPRGSAGPVPTGRATASDSA